MGTASTAHRTTPRALRAGGGPRHRGTPHRAAVLAVLCVSLLVVSLDNTILNVALPSIVRDIGASSSQLQWMVDAYVVVFAGLLLSAGSLGDRIGRRRVFLFGLGVFALGSGLSAFAGSPDHLIATRALMGVGGAAIMPSTLSLLTAVFPGERERAAAIGVWSGTSGLGVAIGPVVGGWLLARFWWGSVFLVNVPIAVLGAVAALWLVPESRDPAAARPDPAGAMLSTAGMGAMLWGVIEAPQRGWGSAAVLGAMAGGVVVLGTFVAWERHSRHPMLPLAAFRRRRFSAAMGAMALVLFGLMGGLFLLTQYLQFSLGYSALQTGLRVVPVAGVLLVAAPLSTQLVRRVGTKPVVGTGMALITAGLWLLSRTTVHGTYLDALPAFFLMGSGAGLAFAPCTDAVMGSLPPRRAGAGAGTNGAALQVGGAVGVAVLGSLLNTRYQGRIASVLAGHAMPASVHDLVTGSLGGALAVAARVGGALGGALAAVARQAFVSGMDLAFAAATAVVGAAAVAAVVLVPNRPAPAPAEGGDPASADGVPAPVGGGDPASGGGAGPVTDGAPNR